MTQRYSIELIEEHDAANFYSIHLDDEEISELERFFEKFPEGCEYEEEVDTIIAWLDKIGERGALERYFRNEGILYIVDKELIGNLNFTRNEKK